MANIKSITEPFSDDKLNRNEIAQHFKNILLNTDLNVFSVVAPWGCGKTYFIQNLIKTMEEDSVNILYNAWESDFYDSPLIPLLVELLDKLENYDKLTELEKDIKSVKELARNLCEKTSFQVGLNFGAVNCSANFDPNKKMIESEYLEIKNMIRDFRNKLQNVQNKLDKKIIIFIDELDRCNPIYTIKTLEVIKHFFGIPNIIFVLSVDKVQIENSVRKIFGINEGQENGYLRKFIDVEFRLPEPDSRHFIAYHLGKIWAKIKYFEKNKRYYNAHLQRIVDAFGYERDIDYLKEERYISELIFQVIELLKFSLRDIERYFARFSLVLDELHEKDVLLIELCIVLNALAMYNIDDFDKFIKANYAGYLMTIDRNILPHWNGLLSGNYKTAINDFHRHGSASKDTPMSTALGLSDYLDNNISDQIEKQEEYIKEYPDKIKFINNFNSLI